MLTKKSKGVRELSTLRAIICGVKRLHNVSLNAEYATRFSPDAQYFQPELEAVQDIRKILHLRRNEELLHFYVVFLRKIVSDSAPR
jgi:hypothetical protein